MRKKDTVSVKALAEKIFYEKIAQYNTQEPQQHNSRIIVLNRDYAMLIYWHKTWTYSIHKVDKI